MAQLESALFQLWHLVKELGLKMFKLIPSVPMKQINTETSKITHCQDFQAVMDPLIYLFCQEQT